MEKYKLTTDDIPPYDTISIMQKKDDNGRYFTEIINYPYDSDKNNILYEGFYDMGFLYSDEKYNVFLSGNNGLVKITKEGESRETLVIIRDSFANPISPFLALHYNLILIDPRFYTKKVSEIVKSENAHAVLIIENMGSIAMQNMKINY